MKRIVITGLGIVSSIGNSKEEVVDSLRHGKSGIRVLEGFWYNGGMIIAYARVSTLDQNLDAQIDALKAAGAEKIFQEKMSGKSRQRPELAKLLEQLRAADVVMITKYDRLARSLRDLIDIVETIRERGAGFRSLAEDIDTTTPTGRLIFHVFGSIAEFERERIGERTKEGLEAARKRGRVGGRPLPYRRFFLIAVFRVIAQFHVFARGFLDFTHQSREVKPPYQRQFRIFRRGLPQQVEKCSLLTRVSR